MSEVSDIIDDFEDRVPLERWKMNKRARAMVNMFQGPRHPDTYERQAFTRKLRPEPSLPRLKCLEKSD